MSEVLDRVAGLSPERRVLLARRLGIRAGTPATQEAPIPRVAAGGPQPLSFAQQRLWFLHQIEPDSPVYNIPLALCFQGALAPGLVKRALEEIVRRHGALRTTFSTLDGEPVQVVHESVPLAAPLADLSGLPEEHRDREADLLRAAEARRLFDIGHGPLLRVLLLRCRPDEHLVLLTLHHLVSDGWSVGVLVAEFRELYGAWVAGRRPFLRELPIQYVDYAVWQRREYAESMLAERLAYWRERLAGAPPALELPSGRPAAQSGVSSGSTVLFTLPAELGVGLADLARSARASLFAGLCAGFAALLGRITGQEDLVFGTVVANRGRVEVEKLIGFFVNTLALRFDLAGDLSFQELLEQARDSVLGAQAHQDLPFEKLVEELALVGQGAGRTPLVQVLLVLQNAPVEALALPGVRVIPVETATGTAKFDLTLVLQELSDGHLGGRLEYSTRLFDPATVRRLLERLTTLLTGALAEPERRLSELPLLGEGERAQLLVEWNDRQVAIPRRAVHELFTKQARRTPEAMAVRADSGSLSYAELDRRSDALAARLRRLGVGPEVAVAVLAERSPEIIVALLAVLKAGGYYVPLDPQSPPQRLAWVLADARAPVALCTGEEFAQLAGESGAVVVRLDRQEPDEGALPAVPVDPDHLAYVMYTSGSTGRPKGVSVSHRAVVRLVSGAGFARLDDEVFLQLAPLPFDASTLEIWGPLLNGGSVALMPPGAPSLEELGAALRRHHVTSLWLTAGLFHQMVESRLEDLAGLRQLLAGGDVLSVPHVLEVLRRAPGVRLINGYGPTEGTTFTCCHPIGEEELADGSVPIGRPIGNTRVYVLDGELEPQPVGVPGELFIGGDGLARGYFGRPDLTAQAFVPDPLGPPGSRLYRSGDRVRYRAQGVVEFLGRLDGQIKIRGFRIELGEIEATLLAHEGVREAAVVAREAAGGRRLVAYVVARRESPPSASELRAFLERSLPPYMVPAAFMPMESLPLTASGKVDRRSLPEPQEAELPGDSEAMPETPLQGVLAAIWCEVLARSSVGIHDSFFELGGHSLLATQVVSRVRADLGVDLPLRALFEGPTIAELAERIARQGAERSAAPPLTPRPRTDSLPLSFAQQRLWFLDQWRPGSPLYNVPLTLAVRGELQPGALAGALAAVVARHEGLRTVFAAVDGQPEQRIEPAAGVPLPLIDLAGLPETTRQCEAQRLGREEATQPFSLARGPLLRAAVLRLAPREHRLLLTLHHIVCDGWSLGVLTRELVALYTAATAGSMARLPELPVQYADYALWQREWLSGNVLAAELVHWRRCLEGLEPVVELPTDRPRPAVRDFAGAQRPAVLPSALAAEIGALARRRAATPFMALFAACAALLGRYTGRRDLALGTFIAGRNRKETEDLIGFFVNTLPVRADLTSDPSFTELLGRIRSSTLEAYAHQDLPFERLIEELAPERDLALAPLVQVALVLQNTPAVPLRATDLELDPLPTATGRAKLDLTLALREMPDGGFAGSLEYAVELFDATTVQRLLENLTTLLGGVVEQPERRLSELPFLCEGERFQLLAEWNDTETEIPPWTLHGLFVEQARRTPGAVAVECGSERVSYAELDRRSDVVAARLQRLGAGPEVTVAVLMNRTADLVTALLAILKAGSAYVPLDPAYPASRLGFMLEDSRAAILLVERKPPESLAASGLSILSVRRALFAPDAPTREREWDGNVLGHLAYVIYTSGSTGRPKGVAIGHDSAVAFLLWAREVFQPEEIAGVLAATSICFDLSVFEIFVPLSLGGAVILVDNVLTLLEPARREGVTLINTVPSAAAELLRAEAFPASARVLNLAGEPLRESLVAEVFSRTGVRRIFNLYGPTEDTTYSTWVELKPGHRGKPTIGRPLTGSCVYVLDPEQCVLPLGALGEICLAGRGLAHGYLHRPDLTAERFVPDPWRGRPGERLYRTGDLGRLLPDGKLEFLGRIDHQVKVRGFRIEPGEVEAVLSSYPGVGEALVLALPDATGELRLAAYIASAVPLTAGELDAFLQEKLPAHLVPSVFVLLAALPRTPNGKVDRAALPDPGWQEQAVTAAPRTPYEEILAALWKALLGRERIDRDESFFALGGHSLLATRMVSAVRGTFGVALPLSKVFERPTIATLAAELQALQGEGRGGGLPPVTPADRSADLPLSFAQQRQWLMAQFDPGSPAHVLPLALRVSGNLRPEVLQRVFAELMARHGALRTRFPVRDGLPVQVVLPDMLLPLPRVDLSVLGRQRAEEEAVRVAGVVTRLPFDLERGPLLRTALVTLESREHVLAWVAHHLIADGWSLGILRQEIAILYQAFAQGRPSPLPPLSLQYADFAVWERRWLHGEHLAEQSAYWRERLADAPVALYLPGGRPRSAVRTTRGGHIPLRLPAELGRQLQALAVKEGMTPFMILVAAFQGLLGRLSGQEDIIVGAPVAGRSRAELEGIVGYFINALPLRTRLTGDPSFRELLGRVREAVLGAYGHQDIPFDRLVEELRPKRLGNRPPFFQMVLNFYQESASAAQLEDLAFSSFDLPLTEAKYDATLYIRQTEERLRGSLAYSRDVFDTTAAERMARSFEALLASALADPHLRLSRLALATEAERLEQTMKKSQRTDASFNKLLSIERKRVPEPRELIRTRPLENGGGLPLVVEPVEADVDLVSWAGAHRGQIEELLVAHGALLFRGFTLSVEDFERFSRTVVSQLVNYVEGSSPRMMVGEKVYTSTEYPPDLEVSMHNELSYAHRWPRKILFFCVTAPPQGGETPIADSRRVLELISPEVRQRFLSKSVKYLRNLRAGEGAGLSWKTVFETDDRSFVESYCREGEIDFQWKEDGGLWTSQVRPAILRHPQTGEMLWFNQVHQFHPSNLGKEGTAALLALHREEDLPIHATFGDGTPLSEADLDEVREAYRRAMVVFPWQEGDLLLADNMKVAHGRKPFKGPRRVVVAMGDTIGLSDLQGQPAE